MRGEQGQAGYWIPGAVSVTFRDMHLGADEVLELMGETGLETIEWSENVGSCLPKRTIRMSLLPKEDGSREIKIDNWNNGIIE